MSTSDKQRRYERLKQEAEEAEDEGNLQQALKTYRKLGKLAYWFVEEENDGRKRPMLETCRSRVKELEAEKERHKRKRNGDGTAESESDADWRHAADDSVSNPADAGADDAGAGTPNDDGDDGEYPVLEPTHGFADVRGMDREKDELRLKVQKPVENPDRAENLGISVINGVCLYGPPGTGKTYVTEALGSELDFPVIKLSGGDITDKFVGEPEKNIKKLFDQARDLEPCLVFIDEIDSVLKSRGHPDNPTGHDKMVNEFLTRMSDLDDNQVVVVGTTNQPEALDEGAIRSGRLTRGIYVGLPDTEARKEVLDYHVSYRQTSNIDAFDIEYLAQETVGYSCADLESILDEAAYRALQEDRDDITLEDLRHGLENTTSTVNPTRWRPYETGEKTLIE